MSITYLAHEEIDKLKWDTCVRNAYNGLIYGYSWYLDVAAEHWDGLIEGDYDRVMPLPYRTTMGIDTIYTPEACPQLGVFSLSQMSSDILGHFLSAIPSRFKMVHISLNKFNTMTTPSKTKTLLCMDLISEYGRVTEGFTEQTRKAIAASDENGLHLKAHISIDDFVEFYGHNGGTLDQYSSMRLASICKTLINLKIAEILTVYSHDNELLAAGLFVAYLNNATVLAVGLTTKGKKMNALYLMFNAFYKSNCNKNITLDCPDINSRVPASFYTGFGCRPFDLKEYRRSSVSWPLSLMFS